MAQGNYNEPFFWHRIVNVGWASGGVVIVEVTALETKLYVVRVTSPEVEFLDFFGGTTISEEDYQESYGMRLNSIFSTGEEVLAEDSVDIWTWDGFFTGTAGDEPFNSSQVAAGTALFGYAPPLHLIGEQVERTHFNPPFGHVALGNVVTHTHPNGHQVTFRQGYTAITHGPTWVDDGNGNDIPVGDNDFSGTESWYWYRVNATDEVFNAMRRQSYLINFAKDFSRRAELRDFAAVLPASLSWNIRGYPSGTSFNTPENQLVTPIGDVQPTFSASGTVAETHDDVIRAFNGAGFV